MNRVPHKNVAEKKLLPIDWNSADIPTMPSIAQRLISIMCQSEIDTQELCSLIAQDPALTAKLLQITNSALYSLSAEVTSIHQAVVLLGQQEVIQLAISTLLAKRFLTVPKELKQHAENLWKHLLATAIIAQDFDSDIVEPDLYTLAMLHDVGWLVLMSQAPTLFLALGQERDKSLEELQSSWGIDHQLWGAKLLEKWSLPEPFQVVAFRHHDPLQETAPPKYLMIISLANFLANQMGHSLLHIQPIPPSEPLLKLMNLDEKALEEMLKWAVSEKEKIELRSRLICE